VRVRVEVRTVLPVKRKRWDERAARPWRELGYADEVTRKHLKWIDRYREYCLARGIEEEQHLTRRDVDTFARRFARQHGLKEMATVRRARAVLRQRAYDLAAIYHAMPPWVPPTKPGPVATLLGEFNEFRKKWRGVRDSTLYLQGRHVTQFLSSCRRRRLLSALKPLDIDRFVMAFSKGVGASALSSACTSIRCFLRFLHVTGRTPIDLSPCVLGPVVSRAARPPRALPWKDVRRILRVIDRKTPLGKRDYAALLLMVAYGMGAGEVLGLRLDDVDWRDATLRVVRPKTGVEILLPLLGPVGHALGTYLRTARQRHPSRREIFLVAAAPHKPLSVDALDVRFRKHALAAGISAPRLGTHMLRHSHACRQIEMAAPTKVVSDIFGHRDPRSISTYARVATQRLRTLCLSVPR